MDRNDRDAGAPDRDAVPAHAPAAVLDEALGRLRLDGAIFFRARFSDPFAIGAAPNEMAGALSPGADRLLEFHIIVAGSARIVGPQGEEVLAEPGDIVVVPYGDVHSIEGSSRTEVVDFRSFAAEVGMPPWPDVPLIEHGGGGPSTEFVCGYLVSDDPLFDPAMRVFPPVFVVRLPADARRWVEASVDYAMASGRPADPDALGAAAHRLPALLVTEVLRRHLATAPAVDRGWVAALHDPVLAPALAALHADPGRHWTVGEIAAQASVSRSVLDERFRDRLGLSPIRYLSEWRMHLADELLATTDATISRSPDAWATTRRRRSAARSSGRAASLRHNGGCSTARPADEVTMDANRWDERYSRDEYVWDVEPNRFLPGLVADLPPGRALDLACGEGRNTVWLAKQGWTTTGVDFSAVGVEKGRRLAADRRVTVEWIVADVTTVGVAPEAFDLVIVFYVQLPAPDRAAMLATVARSLAPGGRFVMVAHDLDNLEHGTGGPQDPAVLPTPELIVADLGSAGVADLVVDRAERITRRVETDSGARDAIDCLVVAHRG